MYGEVGRWRSGSYYGRWIPSLEANDINMSVMALNSWRSDYQNTTVPNNIIISNYDTGDYFYKKTSYLRCRNVTVGYTVPMKNKAVRHLRVYADVNNPFIVTNWTGLIRRLTRT